MQDNPGRFETPAEAQARYNTPIPNPLAPVRTDFAHGAVNDSGTGSRAVLPDELRGFSWPAFLMNWKWAVSHSTWVGLAALVVPFPLMQIVLGIKGNEWAWQNRKWSSVEQFRATQKVWLWWGICWFGLSLLAFAGLCFLLFSLPDFADAFKDFKVEAPGITLSSP